MSENNIYVDKEFPQNKIEVVSRTPQGNYLILNLSDNEESVVKSEEFDLFYIPWEEDLPDFIVKVPIKDTYRVDSTANLTSWIEFNKLGAKIGHAQFTPQMVEWLHRKLQERNTSNANA